MEWKSERRVRQHRKKRHDPGAGQHGRVLRQIDQEERRDGDDRRHLEDHGVGIERVFDQPGLIEQDREPNSADCRQQKSLDCRRQRDQKRLEQQRPIVDERAQDQAGAGQDVGRNVFDPHHRLPHRDPDREHNDRQRDAQRAVAVFAIEVRVHRSPPAAIACASASDARRQDAAYSAEVRKSRSRG